MPVGPDVLKGTILLLIKVGRCMWPGMKCETTVEVERLDAMCEAAALGRGPINDIPIVGSLKCESTVEVDRLGTMFEAAALG